MAETGKPWYLQKSVRWAHFRSMPVKRLWVLMTGVFLLFSVIGPLVDLLAYNGEMPSSHTEQPQFPLGLIAVPKFGGEMLTMAPGDLVVVATDGSLEVADKSGEDYGVERLKDVIAANAKDALPELAAKILAAVRKFGRQFDDQTILLVRRL